MFLFEDLVSVEDRFIQRIWDTLQSLPAYKDRTTLLVTTDHGRGATISDWNDHGRKVPAAEQTRMAALGPSGPGQARTAGAGGGGGGAGGGGGGVTGRVLGSDRNARGREQRECFAAWRG